MPPRSNISTARLKGRTRPCAARWPLIRGGVGGPYAICGGGKGSRERPAVLIPKNSLLGFAAAFAVLLIWSSWLVASRFGAISTLTAYDMAAIRYGISSIIALPVVLYLRPWRTMTLPRIAILTILLGPLYILLVFEGFKHAPASHGGIFMNGILPIATLLIGWIWLSERITGRRLAGAVLILVATALVVSDGSSFDIGETWVGDLLFVGAAFFFAAYLVVSRVWEVTTGQVLLCSSVLNALIFVPLWYLFLPSGLSGVATDQLMLQIVYQGVVPNLIGLLLVALAVRHIGSEPVSAVMAGVPALGAMLGAAFLNEPLGPLSWFAIALLTVGICLMSIKRKPSA